MNTNKNPSSIAPAYSMRVPYLLELCHYIVLNPVRAQMVRSAKEWPWSSYCSTAGYTEQNELLSSDRILASFAQRKTAIQIKYREFIEKGI